MLPWETQVLWHVLLRQLRDPEEMLKDQALIHPIVALQVPKAYLVLQHCHQTMMKLLHLRVAVTRHRLLGKGGALLTGLPLARVVHRGEHLLRLVSFLLDLLWAAILCGEVLARGLIGSILQPTSSPILSLQGLRLHLILQTPELLTLAAY